MTLNTRIITVHLATQAEIDQLRSLTSITIFKQQDVLLADVAVEISALVNKLQIAIHSLHNPTSGQ
jgi:hypothetical protein